jgi:hypothetical protein
VKKKLELMTTAGLEPATFWCRLAIEAKRATIALGSHAEVLNNLYEIDLSFSNFIPI